MTPDRIERLADSFYDRLRARSVQPKEAICILALIAYAIWKDSAVGEYSLDEFATRMAELIKDAAEIIKEEEKT